jgi:signal transduction histidine kinase
MQQGADPVYIGKKSRPAQRRVARDLAWLLAITASVAIIAVRFELNEKIFAITRHVESLQVDEAPLVLFALVSCLSWFAWRRYHDARRELAARRSAEAKLESVLDANRRLAQQYVEIQEQERKTLARELHDELGQYLNAIKTDAVSIHALSIVQHADHVHGVVRDLIRRLRPVALDDLGLKAALEHFADQWQQRFRSIELEMLIDGEVDDLDEQTSLTLFRLAQESMTNIAKHASATRVRMQIVRRGSEIVFSITDNGIGGDALAGSAGLGLIGMRERVEMLGGHLTVTTAPAQGFSILAHVPVAQRKMEEALS